MTLYLYVFVYMIKQTELSQYMRFPTMWYVRPAKPQISFAYALSDKSLCLSLEYSMTVKLLTEHHLEFLSLTGGCTGSSESTLVKILHCWKSHTMAHMYIGNILSSFLDIDECLNNPCLYNGNCSNTNGSYTCNCVPQWTGNNCQNGKLFVFLA